MVEGGPIDVLTGDWLAELTMLILARTRAKRPGGGYARTFVTQMEQVMGTCLDKRHQGRVQRRRPRPGRLRRGRGRGGAEARPLAQDRLRARRRPAAAHGRADRPGPARPLRDRRAHQGRLGLPHGQRLPGLLGHRRRALPRARHRDHRARDRRRRRLRPGGLAPRLEPQRLGRPGGRGRRRAT